MHKQICGRTDERQSTKRGPNTVKPFIIAAI